MIISEVTRKAPFRKAWTPPPPKPLWFFFVSQKTGIISFMCVGMDFCPIFPSGITFSTLWRSGYLRLFTTLSDVLRQCPQFPCAQLRDGFVVLERCCRCGAFCLNPRGFLGGTAWVSPHSGGSPAGVGWFRSVWPTDRHHGPASLAA